ncbi:hypothetical protein ALP44_102701 [Pseudomonas syringae pv. theae]|uniref:Uncharacterized protein n=2 Tax=Pseudomonas syringae group TaxID=136849 RepID=A0A3M2WSE3_PSEA0|nr:hypothetical protein ALQ94_102334 [Pseudomonas amygdali pv. morsprunorum]RMT59862.1 hypothetical protein ALP44_102701 [Pseudomonas syringae pv. theae]
MNLASIMMASEKDWAAFSFNSSDTSPITVPFTERADNDL